MTKIATAAHVLELAMEMERLGQEFYNALALASDNPKVRDFCARIASDEVQHFATFQQLRRDSSGIGASTSDVGKWRALLKRHIQPDAHRAYKVALGGDVGLAIQTAAQMEEDAIVFYESLLAEMPQAASALQTIIEQERHHLADLQMLMP